MSLISMLGARRRVLALVLGVISGELFVEVVWQSDASCLKDVAHLARDVGPGGDDASILSMVASWRR